MQYLEAQYLLSEIKRDTHVLQKNAEVFQLLSKSLFSPSGIVKEQIEATE